MSEAVAERVSAEPVPRPDRSFLRQLLSVSCRPDILSLAGGLPDPALFPTRQYRAALESVLANDSRALQYGPPFEPLKDQIVKLMTMRGVSCASGQIVVTTGAQQALAIASRLFVDPFQPVLTERATYPGLFQAVGSLRPMMLTVGTDLETGMRVDAVEDYLAHGVRPAFIYVIPDGHNPYGLSLDPAQRRKLVDLAREYRVAIVEDDPYGLLSYDRPHVPPLRALDPDRVVYIGTFSKIIAPALRLGWMVLPADLVARTSLIKEAADLESSALTQRAVAEFLRRGRFGRHLHRLQDMYRCRRDALLAALGSYFPPEARWTRPQGGFFVWVELPKVCDPTALLHDAIEEERVAFVPGKAFAADAACAPNGIRLSFATSTPEAIDDGVRRLARLVARRLNDG